MNKKKGIIKIKQKGIIMWEEKDFLKMMQANSDLYGDEISQITGASDTWLINYFEHRLVELFPPYSFINSKYCQVIYGPQGDLDEERLIDGGFGLSVKRCVEIGNFIACRGRFDRYLKITKLSELTTVVVVNYIEHGYPLDDTQYKIVYEPRNTEPIKTEPIKTEGLIEPISEALGIFFKTVFPQLEKKKYENAKLCNTIAFHRQQMKISQTDLAIAVGVSKNAISSYERGKYLPALDVALKLACFLNCKIENLFYWQEVMEIQSC